MAGDGNRSLRTKLPLLALILSLTVASGAHAQAPVPLGTAEDFGVLAGTSVSNTGSTVVNGDLGVSPGSSVTGFPPGTVTGTIHPADATAAQAQTDLIAAYNNAAAQGPTTTIPGELAGRTLTPGLYASVTGAFQLNGTLVLDAQGNSAAVFIFKTTTTLATAAGSQVTLLNGASTCNVFWQVGSDATLGSSSSFAGNVMAFSSITAGTGASGAARLLARNGAVTLSSNSNSRLQCDERGPSVAISGVPRECTSRNFKARVSVSDPAGIPLADVSLDGRRVKQSGRAEFTVRIKAAGLSSGKHVIRVTATDAAGNRTVDVARFRRCARPAEPRFTG
jgi:hypothetical protein